MTDVDNSSDSSDKEYVPSEVDSDTADESLVESDEDFVPSVANETIKKVELDRDAVWTDFLDEKGTQTVTGKAAGLGQKLQVPVTSSHSKFTPPISGLKRPVVSGSDRLSDALKRLKSTALPSGAVPKLTTLEKSKRDWELFTKEQDIAHELKLHNKGKAGYVERKAFESRTSEREYIISKELRLKGSQKR